MSEVDRILKAEPIPELPYKAHVEWPKPKRLRRRGTVLEFHYSHPGTEEARRALELEGRDLETCEECGSKTGPMAIHHVDGNPYNNDPLNLRVVCFLCHQTRHGPTDLEGIHSWQEGIISDQPRKEPDVSEAEDLRLTVTVEEEPPKIREPPRYRSTIRECPTCGSRDLVTLNRPSDQIGYPYFYECQSCGFRFSRPW